MKCANMKCKHKCLLTPHIKIHGGKIAIWNKKKDTSIKHRKDSTSIKRM